MSDLHVTAVVLAAGEGERLQPLTQARPKVTLPTGEAGPLIARALSRVAAVSSRIVVTLGWLGHLVEPYLRSVLVSREGLRPIGTSRGLERALVVAEWDGREPVCLTSGDTIFLGSLDRFFSTWHGERARLHVVPSLAHRDFRPAWRFTGTALLPASQVQRSFSTSGDVVDDLLRPLLAAGDAELFVTDGTFFDCGTPLEYWLAAMTLSEQRSVVEEGACIMGTAARCVVLAGAVIENGTDFSDAVVFPGGSFCLR